MYPDAPFIKRNGEVNAWDNPDFRKAVEATGRKQIILGGIVTEVCKSQERSCILTCWDPATEVHYRYHVPRFGPPRSRIFRLGKHGG